MLTFDVLSRAPIGWWAGALASLASAEIRARLNKTTLFTEQLTSLGTFFMVIFCARTQHQNRFSKYFDYCNLFKIFFGSYKIFLIFIRLAFSFVLSLKEMKVDTCSMFFTQNNK